MLLAQFVVINAVLHKHKSALRFLILPWRIKRFYALLRAPLIHYFWLELPNFSSPKLCKSKFAKLYPCQTFPLYGILVTILLDINAY